MTTDKVPENMTANAARTPMDLTVELGVRGWFSRYMAMSGRMRRQKTMNETRMLTILSIRDDEYMAMSVFLKIAASSGF